MKRLRNDTLVVVTDGEKALFLRNLTDHEDPHLEVVREKSQDNPSNYERSADRPGHDRPGRMPDTGTNHRSALDGVDWHDLAKDRFAKDLSDRLYAKAHKGEFNNLVIAASPQVLGVLREEMHSEVLKRLMMDIPKTLTNHTVRDIERIVKAELDAAKPDA